MKISNSKKQLAKIIHENGGWRDGAGFEAQGGNHGHVGFSSVAPVRNGKVWDMTRGFAGKFLADEILPNWHQTVLSRDEYFHLYPAPDDDDGWIAFNGCNKPDFGDLVVEVMLRDGEVSGDGPQEVDYWDWSIYGSPGDIISYRRHKPEIAPAAQEPKLVPVPDDKPTIEQLAAGYRNAKDYAERKQQEADAAKADAKAKLAELVATGKALGLALSVAEPEPELVITDWRDLQVGDVIEYVDGDVKNKIGMSGPVVEFAPASTDGMYVKLECDNGPNKGRLGWPRQWRFIRRPTQGDTNA